MRQWCVRRWKWPRLTWMMSRWIRRSWSRDMFRNSRNVFLSKWNLFWNIWNMFQDRIRVEVIRRGSGRYRIWAGGSLRFEILEGRLA